MFLPRGKSDFRDSPEDGKDRGSVEHRIDGAFDGIRARVIDIRVLLGWHQSHDSRINGGTLEHDHTHTFSVSHNLARQPLKRDVHIHAQAVEIKRDLSRHLRGPVYVGQRGGPADRAAHT
jgi:hypothetical protein